ncbi:MAG: glycerophosphodiester phosphodiesterase [Bacillota bacterium]
MVFIVKPGHKSNRKPLIIAHRGASSLAPENTVAAFDRAVEAGANGIEFDVQLSKDGIPVVIHDENLERTTTGSGPVKKQVLSDLKSLDAGSWFANDFSGETILTLEELLIRYKDSGFLFNIELKNNHTAYPGLEKKVLQCIEKYHLADRVLISSFNHNSLITCRRLDPAIRTGLLYLEEIKEPWHYARSIGCYSVHPLFIYLQDQATLGGFKFHHIPLYPWTVNDPAQMQNLAAEEVEAIITDFPQELKTILDQMKN